MKTLHLSIIMVIIIVIAISGAFYHTTVFAASPYLEGSGPPNFHLSQIIASGNNVYVAYTTYLDPQNIFFRKSTDGGASFDKIIKITDETGSPSDPHISVSGKNIYLTWFENYRNGDTKVLFKKSTDNGDTFESEIVLNPNAGKGSAVIYEMLAADSNVYVAMNYNNLTSLRANHVLLTSTDNGDTFGKPVTLSEGESLDTKIAVSENNIYVIWEEESICPPGVLEDCQKTNVFFRKSTDNGITFTKPINLSNATLSLSPQIATSQNNVFAVWQDSQYPEVFFSKSSDGGSTFSNKINLSKKLGYDSENPQVAVNGNNVYVLFYHHNVGTNATNLDQGIYITKSSDMGNTFSDPIKLSSDGIGASNFDFASGKNVYLIWNDFNRTSQRGDVFFTKYADNGTIDNVIDLSSNLEENSTLGSIVSFKGENVYVGWGAGTTGDDIYFRTSTDDGNTFGNVINLNHEIPIPEFPFVQIILVFGVVSTVVIYRTRK